MSEPIKVGDLVVVMRDHLCAPRVGHVYRVLNLCSDRFLCPDCGDRSPEGIHADLDAKSYWELDLPVTLPLNWLKRIPPLEELEGQPTQEDMKEPA
jgi:hypothetical protein